VEVTKSFNVKTQEGLKAYEVFAHAKHKKGEFAGDISTAAIFI